MLTRDPITSETVTPPLLPMPNGQRARRRGPSGRLEWGLALIVFLATFVVRFLSLELDNDHFRMITQGRQVAAYGELPFRDFVDPGIFLQILASAAAQALFGYNVLGEALLTVFFLALSAALTFVLASRASRSASIGLVAAVLFVAMFTRLYQYHLAFLPVLGLFVCWRYVDRRTVYRLVVMGLVTAIAFLFRHDLGVYLALAATAVLVVTHWTDGFRILLRRLGLYATFAAIPLVPFFAFLQANGGIHEYFRSGLEYTRSEASRQDAFTPPTFVIKPLPPLKPARVRVRWQEGVTAEVRVGLEQRYHLSATGVREGRTWQYELLDASPSNLAALVIDPRVEDSDNINRRTYRLEEPPEPFAVSWQRSWIGWVVLSTENAAAWLYYLFVGLPVMAVVVLAVERLRPALLATGMPFEAPKVVGVAVWCAAAAGLMLREPLGARLPDAAAATAVLGAWLLGRWLDLRASVPAHRRLRLLLLRPTPRSLFRFAGSSVPLALRVGTALALVGLTLVSVVLLSGPAENLEEARLTSGPRAMLARGRELFTTLAGSPPSDAWAPTRRNVPLATYVRECTRPEDRLLVTQFQPDLYFFAGRAFAGDQIFFFPRYRSSPLDQERTLARLQAQSVPIVLSPIRRYEADFEPEFRLLHDHLVAHYQLMREVSFDETDPVVYAVLVDRRLVPTRTYEPLSLPCFR